MADDLARLGVVIDTNSVRTATTDMVNFERASRAAAQMMLGLVSTATLYQMSQMADAWTRIENQIRLVTASTREYTAAMRTFYDISQRTYTRVQEMGELFSTLTRTTKEVGISSKDTATLIEMIAQAGKLGGSSAAGYSAALMQLNQALASGALRGEEFNSVNEQAPPLIQALADGLGVAKSALRGMAEAGALTTEKILPALLKQAPQVAQQFKSFQMTTDDAWTTFINSSTRMIGALDDAFGFTEDLTNGINRITDAIDFMTTRVGALVNALKYIDSGDNLLFRYLTSGAKPPRLVTQGEIDRSKSIAQSGELEALRLGSMASVAEAQKKQLMKDSGLIAGLVGGDVEALRRQKEQEDALTRAIAAGDKAMERYGFTADQAARALKRLQLATDPLKSALHGLANEMALLAVPEGLERDIARMQQQVAEQQAKAGLPGTTSGSALPAGTTAAGLTVQQRAFLDIIAGPESGGKYNILNGGGTFGDTSIHPRTVGPGGTSTAAGRYQIVADTYDEMGGGSFDPAAQDVMAWNLAVKRYRQTTGGDLGIALASGLTKAIQDALAPTWVTLAAGQDARTKAFAGAVASQPAMNPPSIAAGVTAVNRMQLAGQTAELDRQRLVVELLTKAQGAATDSQARMAEAQRVGLVAAQALTTEKADTLQAWLKEIQAGKSLSSTLGMLSPATEAYAKSLEKMDTATAAQETERLRLQLSDQTAELEATTRAQIEGGDAALRRARIEAQVAQAMQTSTAQAANLRKELEAQEKLTQKGLLGQFTTQSDRDTADLLARVRQFRQGDIAVELGDLQRAARDKARDIGPGSEPDVLAAMMRASAAQRQMQGAQLDRQYDPAAAFANRKAELNRLAAEGAITATTLEKATRDAYTNMLEASDDWVSGAVRGLRRYSGEVNKWADTAETAVGMAMSSMEDALVQFTMTGKFEFKDMVNSMLADIARLMIQQSITKPLANAGSGLLESLGTAIGKGLFGGTASAGTPTSLSAGTGTTTMSLSGGTGVYHSGGIVGGAPPETRYAPPELWANAPRYHGGGAVGATPWLAPGERAIIAQDGEEVLTASQSRALRSRGGGGDTHYYAVDARGSSDPAAVEAAVDRALSRRVPGIVKTSVAASEAAVVNRSQRRGGRL